MWVWFQAFYFDRYVPLLIYLILRINIYIQDTSTRVWYLYVSVYACVSPNQRNGVSVHTYSGMGISSEWNLRMTDLSRSEPVSVQMLLACWVVSMNHFRVCNRRKTFLHFEDCIVISDGHANPWNALGRVNTNSYRMFALRGDEHERVQYMSL